MQLLWVYFINVRNTQLCYIKFDFVRIFHKVGDIGSDMRCYNTFLNNVINYFILIFFTLVSFFDVLQGIGTNSSQCEIYEV